MASENRLSARKATASGVITPIMSRKCPGRGTAVSPVSAMGPDEAVSPVTGEGLATSSLLRCSGRGKPPKARVGSRRGCRMKAASSGVACTAQPVRACRKALPPM